MGGGGVVRHKWFATSTDELLNRVTDENVVCHKWFVTS
ncbi:hypothetical protein KN1_13730 [Stygiolobus caldivivus]|uniref:Uncharacterized protein n=1 Tax=Stygiolobus caldivivus TaxID=2824673 RepID=A0A8D5U5W0_9CREN|nr:hypothetical protein KN1_13730 [Stygiolobus caldivivus]